jgi:hypothetical protein
VRNAAASNLGQLTRLSARVEQLMTDLATNAANAPEPDVAVAYLMALKGGLQAAGDKLQPPTLEKISSALSGMRSSHSSAAGGSDSWQAALAAATGAYAAWTSAEGLGHVITAAAAGGVKLEDRELAAMLLAAVAAAAAQQLEPAGLLRQAVEAGVKFTRDEALTVKVAGGKAIARLYLAYRSTLGTTFVNVMMSLLGPDQHSEVQRQALLSCQRLVNADEQVLTPHMPALLPSVCAVLQRDPSSQVKSAAEQLLKKALQLAVADVDWEGVKGVVAATGGTARAFLTDAYLRRLHKLPEETWVEAEEY